MQFYLPSDTYQQFEQSRRKGLKLSDELRIESKVAIGFLLKKQGEKAQNSLKKAEVLYTDLRSLLEQDPYLYSIGGIQVGTEEFVEAVLLGDYLEGKPLRTLEELGVQHDAYIGGLCDMSGELLRFARMNPDQMKQVLDDLEELNQTCLQIIVTRNGAVRKKLEDLERNMKRMEEMIFQYNLKHV
ncbi:MAG: hypothetical protein Q8O95_02575 [bacterium]|nr:hypothetical protein [bacterium]